MSRRFFKIISGFVLLVLLIILGLHISIGIGVKRYISVAKDTYGGTAEEALISLLMDENVSYDKRSHTAIWTLAQIQSEKALPILKGLYKDDPKGSTCYEKHDSMLCQYEIYKAIKAIEKKPPFSYKRLNKQDYEKCNRYLVMVKPFCANR